MTDFSFKPDDDETQQGDAAPLPPVSDDTSTRAAASAPADSGTSAPTPAAPSPPLPPIPAAAKSGAAASGASQTSAAPKTSATTAPSPPLPPIPATQKPATAPSVTAPSPPLPTIPAAARTTETARAPAEEWSLDDAPTTPQTPKNTPSAQPANAQSAVIPPTSAPLLPGSTAPTANQNASTRSAPPKAGTATNNAAQRGAAPSKTTGARPPMTKAKAAPAPALPSMNPAQAQKGMPASGELARNQMKTSAREHVDARPLWRQYFDRLDPIAMWLSMASLAVGGLCLLYLLYAIFGVGIGTAAGNNAQMADTITKVATGLRLALIVSSLSLIVLMFDVTALGPSMALLGFALYFGAPLILKPIGDSLATRALVLQLIPAGKVLLFVGLLKYSLNLGAWLATLPQRMKSSASVGIADLAEPAQQRTAKHANMFSPCWQLPFCREVIRKQCPAYLARTRCWKFGRGCYCDEEMISRIIRGENTEQVKAPTRMSRQGKPPCGRCYIFLEHQSLKYKSLAWLAIPATAAIAFFGWPIYVGLFALANTVLGNLWTRLAFSKATDAGTNMIDKVAGSGDLSQYQMSPEQVQAAAQGIFGVVLGFFILIYISKFIEWAIYKAKW